MKKIIATVLAMVMALALCTTAFAAEKTYEVYNAETEIRSPPLQGRRAFSFPEISRFSSPISCPAGPPHFSPVPFAICLQFISLKKIPAF